MSGDGIDLALDAVLAGQTALVTGASGGLGQAIAETLAGAGADVALHYYRHRDRAEALADRLRARFPGRRFPVFRADLTNGTDVDALFDAVAAVFPTLHIVVNNAGINRDRTLRKAVWDDWRAVIELNLVSVARCCQQAAVRLPSGGRIINISSVIGFTGNIGQTNYAAAKAGLVGLTKSLAQELAHRGVTVNAIAPGFVETPMTAGMPAEAREHWARRAAVGRFAKPAEIAWAALFLAAPWASYVTGTVIHVNGGTY
jgi:3-oxoacyl-[acyl-carrier protein] reductase